MIDTATKEELIRLLGLFPVEALHEAWPDIKGNKDAICSSVAEDRDLQSILRFVHEEFLRCRQHVYVYENPNSCQLPTGILEGDREALGSGGEALYLARLTHHVFLENPLREEDLTFIWPIQIRLEKGYVIVRFVTLEKNLQVYLREPYSKGTRSITETKILEDLMMSNGLVATNLHAGIKNLWDADFLDAYRVEFKGPNSTTTEKMDREVGIKQYHPELYEIVKDAELLSAVFKVLPEDEGQQRSLRIHIEPAKGKIVFSRYSQKGDGHNGDSAFVVDEIIRLNQ